MEEEGHEYFLVQGLSPLTGVLTEGDTLEEAKKNAREALTGVLGSMLDHGDDIPDPTRTTKKKDVYWIEPDPKVAIPILVKKTRLAAGMTLEELAGKSGVSYQQIQRWERSGTNPTISSLEKVFRAMGKRLGLEVA
jgi:predicted RNase H-like HicB family nuclease/DNA-binding XRE family transcriptional regulator